MTSTTANVTLELGRPEQSPIPNKSARKQAAQPTLALLAGFVLAICLAAAAFGYAASLSSRIDTLESQLATLQADDRADSQRMDAVLSPSVASPAGYGAPVSLLTGTGAWALGAPMPYERSDLQTIACNGTVVLLGGLDAAHAVVGDVVTFDPIHETYSTARAPMPTARYRFGAACLDHKIYVAGGFENATAGNNGWSLDTCDVYDVARDTWAASSSASSAACPRLGVARGDLALAALDGKLHAVGGYDWSYSEVATHEIFDPTNPAAGWAAAAPMPNAKGDVQVWDRERCRRAAPPATPPSASRRSPRRAPRAVARRRAHRARRLDSRAISPDLACPGGRGRWEDVRAWRLELGVDLPDGAGRVRRRERHVGAQGAHARAARRPRRRRAPRPRHRCRR